MCGKSFTNGTILCMLVKKFHDLNNALIILAYKFRDRFIDASEPNNAWSCAQLNSSGLDGHETRH